MSALHFLYHELRPDQSRYTYVMSCEEFEAHCAFFARLIRKDDGRLLRPEITFDDGHRSDLTYAAPILARHGLRARFFITAGWTAQRTGFMDWTELRQLHAAGHSIGAHGLTHKLLTACTTQELKEELQGARHRLEDGLGAAVTSMSLPGGRFNRMVLHACEEAGFVQVFTSVPKAEPKPETQPLVGRLNLLNGTSVDWLGRVLDPRTGALARLERMAALKGLAKRVLGDAVYAKLWAIGSRQEPEADAEAVAP